MPPNLTINDNSLLQKINTFNYKDSIYRKPLFVGVSSVDVKTCRGLYKYLYTTSVNIYFLHLDVDGPALVHVDGLAALLLPVASDPGTELHVLPRPGVQSGEPLQRGGRRLHPDLPVLALVTPQFV